MRTMKAGFDRGRERRPYQPYSRLEWRIGRLRRNIERLRAKGADQAEIDAALAKIKAIAARRSADAGALHSPLQAGSST
jgi:hypothetical protein